VNGEEFHQTDKNIGDRTRPTMFDPRTNTVTALAPWTGDPTMRGYHAVSLLLKDGRVLVGGGRIFKSSKEGTYRIGCERPELRVFSPPYLSKGDRPVIGARTPQEIAVGGKPFTIKFTGPAPRAKGGVVLMALGAFTHGFDQNQRAVPLTAAVSGAGEVTVTPPMDSWAAPEGDYNLFLVSDEGVPSVATSVRIVAQR
jgi:galactose oxidase-like protein